MAKIAIIGSGLIGRAWATVFASHGFEVALHDANPDQLPAARKHIAKNLRELAAHGLIQNPGMALRRVRIANGLGDALKGVVLAQESGPEQLEMKRALFAQMDKLAPKGAILASSTSFIIASAFSEGLPGRHRCLVAHSGESARSRSHRRAGTRALDRSENRRQGQGDLCEGRAGADRAAQGKARLRA